VARLPFLLLWLGFALSARAQLALGPEGLATANRFFNLKPSASLKCEVYKREPFMDFMFRYTLGYWVDCRFDQLEPDHDLVNLVRVTPQGAGSTILGEKLHVDPLPPGALEKLHGRLQNIRYRMSGAVALGEGRYTVELLVAERRGRQFRKRWTITVKPRSREKTLAPTLAPNTVAPLLSSPWDGRLTKGGLRVTVLLHAASMNPRASKLYAWDRAFLLQSLTSLLKQIPCESVSLIAFNLDQEREVFREEKFDAAGFEQLAERLRKLELATTSYKALSRQNWHELLTQLTEEQLKARHPADAVIFLGATTHFDERVPKEWVHRTEPGSQIFYFEYFPWRYDFPDAIERLTRDMHGTVFKIHSPGELGQSIQKMLALTKTPRSESTPLEPAK
jgi:hypothetical protein